VAAGSRRHGSGSAVRKWRQAGGGKAGRPRRARWDELAAARRWIGCAQVAAGWWRAGEGSAAGEGWRAGGRQAVDLRGGIRGGPTAGGRRVGGG